MITESPSITSTTLSPDSITDGGTANIIQSFIAVYLFYLFFTFYRCLHEKEGPG
jgi:hypothetical protein